MARVYGNPFKLDWTDLDVVIAYAKRLGKDQVVVKHPNRANYNITFASCPERYEGAEILFRT